MTTLLKSQDQQQAPGVFFGRLCQPSEANLALSVAKIEEAMIQNVIERVLLYVVIPFCPSVQLLLVRFALHTDRIGKKTASGVHGLAL
jgi:hypothetical protein